MYTEFFLHITPSKLGHERDNFFTSYIGLLKHTYGICRNCMYHRFHKYFFTCLGEKYILPIIDARPNLIFKPLESRILVLIGHHRWSRVFLPIVALRHTTAFYVCWETRTLHHPFQRAYLILYVRRTFLYRYRKLIEY